ncbi:MAG: hypothetical protein GY861_05240, partial [bacterium]|nr:hypothetical protein [bacterium]
MAFVTPGTKFSEADTASGTPYLSCEDVEMSDSMPKLIIDEKTHSDLGLFPEFVSPMVIVTAQIKSGP